MRTRVLLCGLIAIPVLLNAQPREERIAKAVASLQDSLVAQRRDFHMHPELSNREERTSKVIQEKLKALGFDDIRTGVSRHGIVALLKGGKPGPVVAIRADMDALPIEETLDVPYKSKNKGVKHACGHDVHMTVALGTAEVLSKMRNEIPGSVKFIFQPAEEGAPEGEDSGAVRMIREGALEDPKPKAIFALHTNPLIEAAPLVSRRALYWPLRTRLPFVSSAKRYMPHGRTRASIRLSSPPRPSWRSRPSAAAASIRSSPWC